MSSTVLSLPGDTVSAPFSLIFGFLQSFCPLFSILPEPFRVVVWYRRPVYDWELHRHLFSIVWSVVSLWSSCHPLCKLLMKAERWINLWMLRYVYLYSFTLCLFRKTLVVGSPPGPMRSLAVFWPDLKYKAWVSSLEWTLSQIWWFLP